MFNYTSLVNLIIYKNELVHWVQSRWPFEEKNLINNFPQSYLVFNINLSSVETSYDEHRDLTPFFVTHKFSHNKKFFKNRYLFVLHYLRLIFNRKIKNIIRVKIWKIIQMKIIW